MTRGFDNNEKRYQQLFFESPAVMIIFKSDTGDIISINQAAIDYYGYSADEFGSMNIFNINTAEEAFIFECIRGITMLGKHTFLFKHRLKNSEVRDVEVFSRVINFEDEKLIYSIVVDVTDKLKSEEELKESRERLALVLAGTRAGIWDNDLINKTYYIDKQWKAILGYEEHELSGNVVEWENRRHPEEIESINQKVRQSEKEKADYYEIEHRLRHKDGTYRWVNTTGKIIYNEKKEPIRSVGTITDITKIKEVEDRILESQNKLIDFARAIPDFSAIVDEDGRYIEVLGNDKRFLEPDKEIQGQTIHQLFPQDLADPMLEDITQVILTGENKCAIREMDFGPEKRYFEARLAPMNYQVNGKKTVAIVISNITERFIVDQMLKFTYELQRKSDFINDILRGNVTYNKITISMANELGINFGIPLCCFLIRVQEVNRNNQNDVSKMNDLKNQINQIIYLISTSTKYFVWNNRDKVGILCQDGDFHNMVENSIKKASELKKMIISSNPNLIISIGISDIHSGFGSLEKSYQEARNTLISARCLGQEKGGIYQYRDIGLFQILAPIYENDCSSEFVQKMIGPLIEHDFKKGTNLLITLEEILQSNNLKDSAKKLFIHHKTLVFRKKRIEEILRVCFDNFETRLALAAAIKLYQLNNNDQSTN